MEKNREKTIKNPGRGALMHGAAGRGTWAVGCSRMHVRERDDLHGTRI